MIQQPKAATGHGATPLVPEGCQRRRNKAYARGVGDSLIAGKALRDYYLDTPGVAGRHASACNVEENGGSRLTEVWQVVMCAVGKSPEPCLTDTKKEPTRQLHHPHNPMGRRRCRHRDDDGLIERRGPVPDAVDGV